MAGETEKDPQLRKEAQGGWDHTAEQMTWEILVLAGDPTDPTSGALYSSYMTHPSYFGCPDNACIDPNGRLWISTDGSEDTVGFSDGLYGIETHGETKGMAHRIFQSPIGAEVTGPCFSDDGCDLFVAVQHPNCAWPFEDDVPRPSVVVLQRNDGAEI